MRLIIRLVGYSIIAIGFAMLVIDGTASIGAGNVRLTQLSSLVEALAPLTLTRFKDAFISYLGVTIWDISFAALMSLPAFVVFMVLGLALIILARRAKIQIGFKPMQ